MIAIGASYGGPELRRSEIDLAVTALTKALNELRGPFTLGETPAVVPLFMVPGSVGQIDFEGLRYGKYSRRDKAIVVQVAVPATVVAGSNVNAFLIDSLRGANAMAFEFFRKKGVEFPLRQAEDLVSATALQLPGTFSGPTN